MMCLASCQVFGEILGKTIKEPSNTTRVFSTSPNFVCNSFPQNTLSRFSKFPPRLAYSAVMQPASWRVRSGSETSFKAPPSWNSRQPTKNCCFGAVGGLGFRRGKPRKMIGSQGFLEIKVPRNSNPKPPIYHELTMEEPPVVPRVRANSSTNLRFRENQKITIWRLQRGG